MKNYSVPLVGQEAALGFTQDFYFISPIPISSDRPLLQFNRGGLNIGTPPDFYVERNTSNPINLLHCVMRGQGSVSIRGRTYRLEKGNIFLLPAQESHIYRSNPDSPMTLSYVEYGGHGSQQLTAQIVDNGGPVYSGPLFSLVLEVLQKILVPVQPSPSAISLLLYELLMLFYAHFEQQSSADPVQQQVLDYIEANLSRSFTLSEIAEKFNFNPSYFSARFSKYTGMPFQKYVMSRRIRQACYLLSTTDLSMEQIAHSLGFYDQGHFATRFKAQEGVAPSQYRKREQLK